VDKQFVDRYLRNADGTPPPGIRLEVREGCNDITAIPAAEAWPHQAFPATAGKRILLRDDPTVLKQLVILSPSWGRPCSTAHIHALEDYCDGPLQSPLGSAHARPDRKCC
jgi:hypothetical protein